MFGRATIRLGIGPHSSLFFLVTLSVTAACDRLSRLLVSFLARALNIFNVKYFCRFACTIVQDWVSQPVG